MSTITRRVVPACLLSLAATLALGGCYKGEMEAQKARADAAEQKAKELETQLGVVRKEADSAKAQAQVVLDQRERLRQKAVLATIVNGQVYGTDEIRLTDTGQFLKHGVRTRSGSAVQFDSGRLIDQRLVAKRDDGKTYFEGDIKNSRPEGEWTWFARDGKPQFKEVWKDGKLTDLLWATVTAGAKPAAKPATTPTPATPATTPGPNRAVVPGTKPVTPAATPTASAAPAGPPSASSEDKVTWKSVNKAERDARVKDTALIFVNLPELIRE